MRYRNPPFQPMQSREEREQSIKSFILQSLDASASGLSDAIAVLAHSPESPVVKALLSLSDELARHRVGAVMILTGGAMAAEDETWSLSFAKGFAHEIRLTSNPRILDGHEQLIVGARSIWYGDCMRRDPAKRDAYSVFMANQQTAAHQGRVTFSRLWAGAQSIYLNPALSAVVVTAGGLEATRVSLADDVQPPIEMPASLEAGNLETGNLETGNCEAGDLEAGGLEAGGPALSVAETLQAWRPLTRH